MRKLILAVTFAALAVPAIVPALSSAAPTAAKTITIMTHSAQHPDTTWSGAVWALDNLSLKYDVKQVPNAVPTQWVADVTSQGSFAGTLNPDTGLSDINNGSVTGTIEYTVTSPNAPDKANVPAQEQPGSSIREAIRQMFHLTDDTAISGGDIYDFIYNKVDGKVYEQKA
jgi:hypothetical protein